MRCAFLCGDAWGISMSQAGTHHFLTLQNDIKAAEQQITTLKGQQDEGTQAQHTQLAKAADKLGLKLATQQGKLDTHNDDIKVCCEHFY
jgi:hypothetical protein